MYITRGLASDFDWPLKKLLDFSHGGFRISIHKAERNKSWKDIAQWLHVSASIIFETIETNI